VGREGAVLGRGRVWKWRASISECLTSGIGSAAVKVDVSWAPVDGMGERTFGCGVDTAGATFDVQALSLLDHVVEIADFAVQLVFLLQDRLDALDLLVQHGHGVSAETGGCWILRELALKRCDQLLRAERFGQAWARSQRMRRWATKFRGHGFWRGVSALQASMHRIIRPNSLSRDGKVRQCGRAPRVCRRGRRKVGCAIFEIEKGKKRRQLIIGHADAELERAKAAATLGQRLLDVPEVAGRADVRPAHSIISIVHVQFPLHRKAAAAGCSGSETAGAREPFLRGGPRLWSALASLGLRNGRWDELALVMKNCHRVLDT